MTFLPPDAIYRVPTIHSCAVGTAYMPSVARDIVFGSATMNYSFFMPPTFQPFREMDRRTARSYFKWFVEQIPQRVAILERAVQTSHKPEWQVWDADRTPESLNVLGEWFAEHVGTQKPSQKLLEKLKDRSPLLPTTVDWVLSDTTMSLTTDVAIYLGEVFIKNHSGLTWDLFTRGKLNVDYHQPVLTGFTGSHCNPQRLTLSIAVGLVKKSYSSQVLREVYETWAART